MIRVHAALPGAERHLCGRKVKTFTPRAPWLRVVACRECLEALLAQVADMADLLGVIHHVTTPPEPVPRPEPSRHRSYLDLWDRLINDPDIHAIANMLRRQT